MPSPETPNRITADSIKVWLLGGTCSFLAAILFLFMNQTVRDSSKTNSRQFDHESRIVRIETIVRQSSTDISEIKDLVSALLQSR